MRLKTRAGVRMRANRGSVSPGGSVHFTGRLRGGHSPRGGVLVELQGHQAGFGWRTFKTVRARHGRFSGGYRFVRAAPARPPSRSGEPRRARLADASAPSAKSAVATQRPWIATSSSIPTATATSPAPRCSGR